jgi:hypothetical protein
MSSSLLMTRMLSQYSGTYSAEGARHETEASAAKEAEISSVIVSSS